MPGSPSAGTCASSATTHVVLERGRVGERWHNERWDSMSLLTPNWLNVLPGQTAPDDPHGFASRAGFAYRLGEYARSFAAPVVEQTAVGRVDASTGWPLRRPHEQGHLEHGQRRRRDRRLRSPRVPAVARAVPAGIVQLHVTGYRRPELLPPGGVLVVGAGPSGQQVARELCRAGRDVVLCVGRHARAPRRYRGEDIWYWLDAIGSLDTSDRRDARCADRAHGAEHPADGVVRRRRHRPRQRSAARA